MNINTKGKKYTLTGLIIAILIAVYLSLVIDFGSLAPKGGNFADYIVVVIAARALFIVTSIWFFYERFIKYLSKYISGEHDAVEYTDKRAKIITWYLMLEILMLITFI